MTSPVFTARVPFTAPQIGAQYDPQQMRTVVNGIARAIPPMVTRTVTASTKISATDDTLLVDTTSGAVTVTLLPANQVQFLRVQIKNIGTSTVTIVGTVDGASSPSLASLATLVIQSDGVAWRKLHVSNDAIFDVLDYGATGLGLVDESAAFAAAVAALAARGGGELYVPAGTYLMPEVNPNLLGTGAITMVSNMWLHLAPGATLQAIPSTLASYSIVYAQNVSNVMVSGGAIVGERATFSSSRTGEFGFGIDMRSCAGVTIEGVNISDCWGDGILISAAGLTTTPCTDVTVDGVNTVNCRRQGMSIVCAKRMRVIGCGFRTTNGTPPAAGIDCEPDPGYVVEDVAISACDFDANTIGVLFAAGAARCTVTGSTFRANTTYGVQFGITMGEGCAANDNTFYATDATQVPIYFGFSQRGTAIGNTITGTFQYGIWARGGADPTTAGRNNIQGNTITGDGTGTAIYASNLSDGNTIDKNVIANVEYGIRSGTAHSGSINGNRITAPSVTGIDVQNCNYTSVKTNTVTLGAGNGIFAAGGINLSIDWNTATFNGTQGINVQSTVTDSSLQGNIVHSNSQLANITYDNISVSSSSRMTIQNNVVRKGSLTNKPRNGLTISGANHSILWNDFVGGGQTADISDTSTNSRRDYRFKTATDIIQMGASPLAAYPVDVDMSTYGGSLFRGINSTLTFNMFSSTSNFWIGLETSHSLIFRTNATDQWSIDGGGRFVGGQTNSIIVGGATSIGFYNAAKSAQNLNILDGGEITVYRGRVTLSAATTAHSSLLMQPGTAPTSPTNGDIWFDGTNVKIEVGGVTKTFTLT